MEKNYVSENQMDGKSFKQKNDDQGEKDDKGKKGEKPFKPFHSFICYKASGHEIFAMDDIATSSNPDAGVDAYAWEKLYTAA